MSIEHPPHDKQARRDTFRIVGHADNVRNVGHADNVVPGALAFSFGRAASIAASGNR